MISPSTVLFKMNVTKGQATLSYYIVNVKLKQSVKIEIYKFYMATIKSLLSWKLSLDALLF